MTALILLQIVLPVGLLAWLALLPAPGVLGYLLQAIGVGLFLFAPSLIAMWTMPPWWAPWILPRRSGRAAPWWRMADRGSW